MLFDKIAGISRVWLPGIICLLVPGHVGSFLPQENRRNPTGSVSELLHAPVKQLDDRDIWEVANVIANSAELPNNGKPHN